MAVDCFGEMEQNWKKILQFIISESFENKGLFLSYKNFSIVTASPRPWKARAVTCGVTAAYCGTSTKLEYQ